jgi:hypothetical protein
MHQGCSNFSFKEFAKLLFQYGGNGKIGDFSLVSRSLLQLVFPEARSQAGFAQELL